MSRQGGPAKEASPVSNIRKISIRKTKNKPMFFTAERTLLAGVIGLAGMGLAQPTLMSIAFNDSAPQATMIATTKSPADYTPVGSIERQQGKTDQKETLPKDVLPKR
jgi:hypothetical protein